MLNDNMNTLSKEDFLIRLLLKHDADAGRIDEAIRSGVDWQRVLDRSVAESVFYPFYRQLTTLDVTRDVIPPNFREKFRQTYLSHIAQSENFSNQVTRTLERLDALNIEILFFKGPAVDALIYTDFFRPRVDLDIVIHGNDTRALENVIRLDNPLKLHVHSHLMNNTWLSADNALATVDMKKIWQETASFGTYRNIRALGPEMNILFLCEHALKHDVDQLVFLYEIDRLIRFYGARFDWRKFIALAEDFGLGRIVYYGLYFTKEMLSGDVPDETLHLLKPERVTAAEKIFIEDTMNRRVRRYSAYCVYLAARKGMMKKARFLLRTVFSPSLTLRGHLGHIRNAAAIFLSPEHRQ
jgi:hypothetical protein